MWLLIEFLSEELPHSLGPVCSGLDLEFRPRLGLYSGETHNSRWEIYAHDGRPRSVVIIGVCGKNNPVGNVFSRSFTALSANLGTTTLPRGGSNASQHEKETHKRVKRKATYL